MGRSDFPTLRSLTRIFLPDLEIDLESPLEPISLPKEEVEKLRKILRLEEGSHIAVLPNDGSLIRCEFREKQAWPLETEFPGTEHPIKLTLAQAFPKGDRIDTILRMATELGVAHFLLFPADRSVVRWDPEKLLDKQRRFQAVIRESAEQSFRSTLPSLAFASSLKEVLEKKPEAMVLSEVESESQGFTNYPEHPTIVIGPEGGWSPRELEIIGDRGVTMGPLVFRTDTAGIAACAAILIPARASQTV